MSNRSPEGLVRALCASVSPILMGLLLYVGQAQALSNDRDQPINISADKAVRDDKQGFTVYSGDVKMDQGSMHIEADVLTIYHTEEDAEKIVAEGKPAKMRQRPDLDKGIVYARAYTIEYFRKEERVHLETEARIEQDGGTVAGDSIDYFIADELVKAVSNEAQEGNRVQVVIPPSAQQSMGISPRDEGGEQDSTEGGGAPVKSAQNKDGESQAKGPVAAEPKQVEEESDSGATESE